MKNLKILLLTVAGLGLGGCVATLTPDGVVRTDILAPTVSVGVGTNGYVYVEESPVVVGPEIVYVNPAPIIVRPPYYRHYRRPVPYPIVPRPIPPRPRPIPRPVPRPIPFRGAINNPGKPKPSGLVASKPSTSIKHTTATSTHRGQKNNGNRNNHSTTSKPRTNHRK